MITLAAIRDYLQSLNVADNYYIGKLEQKKEKSIGVYQRNSGMFRLAIGGLDQTKYEVKPVSILIHWNRNAKETEQAALSLFYQLIQAENITIGDDKILFMLMQTPEPIDVGLDESSNVYERVIQLDVYCERG